MHSDSTAAATREPCPTRRELVGLLHDNLDDAAECLVASHLSDCEDCRQALEDVAGEPSWWNEAQTYLAGEAEAPMLAASATGRHLQAFDADCAAEIRKWLGPTDDPRSLGRIGRFEVTGIVGAGSMGVVLKALEPQLKRYVAVKVLLPILAYNGAARRRFDREARAAAAVNHPHVVPIYGVDEYQGLPYLVMQYVPGQSLAQRIAEGGPLAADEVVRIALQTARALAAAHEQGLVHRDIKPANILLENGIERVLVTDFGLARIADDASMTRSGVITGTPQFMSPEQASGRDVDIRSDLFSLGAVMYAMCTGHTPFRSATVFGLLKRICEDKPRSIRAVNSDIPEWLERFILKLLAKEPADRFATAAQAAELLASELAHLQNPSGVRQPPRPWLGRTSRFPNRLFGHATSAAALAGIIACGVLLTRPPAASVHRGQSTDTVANVSGDEWVQADFSLDEITAEIERLEQRPWSDRLTPPVDPWSAEAQALRNTLETVEQLHRRSF